MGHAVARLVDFVTASPVRLLRVSALAADRFDRLVGLRVGGRALAAVGLCGDTLHLHVRPRTGVGRGGAAWPGAGVAASASTGIDVLAVVALSVVSGGTTVAVLPVFFLLPISVAFQDRPGITAAVGVCTTIRYLGVWIVYCKHNDTVELPTVVYTHFGLLLWLAAAMTALCYFLTRTTARVAVLLQIRRTLVAEAIAADERNSRALAEHLHDSRCRICWRRDLNLTKSTNGMPIRAGCRLPSDSGDGDPGCAAPSPRSSSPRCSPEWASPPRSVS